jgi:serine phosphatase RsbU (regulator of sigma subunit)
VGEALNIRDVDEMTEIALETIVEAFECETAVYLMLDEDQKTFLVKASFDGEGFDEPLPCPQKLLSSQDSLLLQNEPELIEQWKSLGFVNGVVCSFVNVDSEIVGAVVCGNTAQGVGTYVSLEEQHKSSFSVLVSQVASLRENLLLGQKVQNYVQELEEHRALLEHRVEERTSELAEALDIVKQSINYAARIQRSTLPDVSIMKDLLSDFFIIWQPRDTVGGDMYWVKPWGDGLLMILGDCTGHGVPGAFVTLLSSGAIERAMLNAEPGDLPSLLNLTHRSLQIALGQTTDYGESDDGIELGACYFKPGEDRMFFSGAMFDLFVLDAGELEIVKGTKKGMGYRNISRDQAYEGHDLEGLSSKTLFLTTDGFLDQVGGVRGRMFGKKRFREMLTINQNVPMAEQKELFYQALLEYQGEQKRRDDVAVIGFKV